MSDAATTRSGPDERAPAAGPVTFVGAGQMGAPMVQRLLRAGVDVTLHARRPEVRQTFTELGAHTTASLADAVKGAGVVISCLFNESQVEQALLAPDGLIALLEPGTVLVSHTTVGIRLLARVDEAATARGVSLLDAPVSGAPDDILAGRLTILAGGDPAVVERARPALETYGTVLPTGPTGSASRVKLVNNLLFTVNVQTAAAAAALGQQLGVETKALFTALQHCSAATRAIETMRDVGSIERYAELGAKYLRKDVAAALATAAEEGADPGVLAYTAHHGPLPLTAS
ncbi:NAD(P)-dependent oxidoreductase [Frankia sp. CNm7]|uniref:NAD(P)-dependent oxidoreductase n=1 Tax=Frankia nepalensis TaxID=1836974 RepID=A0A937RI14_9ACTN|nr:NAD(P)-dependent oxidoreductase [Frankia nepalensis]MBL7502039.1 NAD(P)-dependent oxidoreductase [Frankia nepalensis]MBL7511945.1 NAD(P)-dependent oxidoreductase [Frankia nepalensis]MBL7524282.1 NAD(P)-dependent oxidoreductase [Frankia nepalensis]MBL7630537.1 NAD(P)-dependent oxidoreductase [Frankia nepalensis]